MGFSPDGLPVVGPVPGLTGAWAVAGFTGHGMSLAMRTGHVVAAQLIGREDAYLDLFAADRLVSSA